MPEEVRLWSIGTGDQLRDIPRASLELEQRIEKWLDQDISILDSDLIVIGRQVQTEFGGIIDLLCLHRSGDLVVVELKRDKTPREVTAQLLDYGSWVTNLSSEKISEIASTYLHPETLDVAFKRRFGSDLPETLNEEHQLMVVASKVDDSTERIIRYLSNEYGVQINAATFQFFRTSDSSELLARVFLIEPEQAEETRRARGTSKRLSNLTSEELQALARQSGVEEIYEYTKCCFEQRWHSRRTRSSLGFAAVIDGGKPVVISLLPGGSNGSDGLKFQVYLKRLCTYSGQTQQAIDNALPSNRSEWHYNSSNDADYSGYEGFFANKEEVDRLINVLPANDRSV